MEEKTKNKIDAFFSKFNLQKYKKGEIIIHPNKNPLGAYFIKNGFVKTYGISRQGIETTVHLFTLNSYFPMMWIISDIPNRFHFEALTSVELHIAPKEKVLNFLRKNPDVLFDLTGRLLKGLDKLTIRIEQLSIAKASSRVASILLFLARHFGEKKDNRVILQEMFTHKDIASLAGLSRETTSREWKNLQKKGLVLNNKRSIVINNLQSLEKEI